MNVRRSAMSSRSLCSCWPRGVFISSQPIQAHAKGTGPADGSLPDTCVRGEAGPLCAGERPNTIGRPTSSQRTGATITLRGYSDEDVRAIQRGCNIIDDTQGRQASDVARERWSSTRFIRGKHLSCTNCHRGAGDRQDDKGNPLKGTLNLGTSWVMADMYDRFTGLLLPYELRQMQCYINSSNGYKPNIADDLIRDVTAYSRFLSAAMDLKSRQSLRGAGRRRDRGIRHPEAGRRLRSRRSAVQPEVHPVSRRARGRSGGERASHRARDCRT